MHGSRSRRAHSKGRVDFIILGGGGGGGGGGSWVSLGGKLSCFGGKLPLRSLPPPPPPPLDETLPIYMLVKSHSLRV